MTILGNIFLVLAALLYCIYLYVVYQDGAERSGDAAGGGGYGVAVLLFSVVFAGLMLVVAIAVTAKDPMKQMSAILVFTGDFQEADEFRYTIQRKSDLEEYEFEGDTCGILATVDKFGGLGVDYVPAVRALRAALDEPRTQPLRLNSATMLDRWLKEH